jgi:hypothetical protein
VVLIQDSVHFSSGSIGLDFHSLPGEQGVIFNAIDVDGNPVENVVVSIQLPDGSGPVYQAVTNGNGNAVFEGDELETFTPYSSRTSWPQGYTAITQNQNFEWTGAADPQPVVGMAE